MKEDYVDSIIRKVNYLYDREREREKKERRRDGMSLLLLGLLSVIIGFIHAFGRDKNDE